MKKFITYGVAAALTMSSFALPARVPVYADDGGATVSALTCAGTDTAADVSSTVVVGKTATECVLKFDFEHDFSSTPPGNYLILSGDFYSGGDPTLIERASVLDEDDKSVVTVTINQLGINRVRSAGDSGVLLTVKGNEYDESYSVKLVAEQWEESFTYSVNDNESVDATTTDGVTILSTDTKLSFEAVFKNELHSEPSLNSVKFEGLISGDPNSTMVSWVVEQGHIVKVDVTEKGFEAIKNAGEDGLAFVMKDNTTTYTLNIKMIASVPVTKITAQADNETVEAGGEAVITPTVNDDNYTTDVYDVVYEVTEGADYVDGEITVDADGKGNVKFKNAPYAENKTVKISAKAMVDGEPKATSDDVVVTVSENVKKIEAELSEGSISGTTDTENKKDSSTATGKVTEGGYTGNDIVYTVDSKSKGSIITVDDHGVIRVVDSYVASENKEVKITVSAKVDNKDFEDEVTLNVLPNFTEVKTDALETTDVTMDAPVSIKASTNYPGSLVPEYKFEATENADAVEIETVNNTATVKVNGKHVSKGDTKVLVKVSAKIGDVTVEKADKIELTVKPNFTKVELNTDKTEVNAGDTATVTATTDYEGTQEAKYDFQMIGGVEGITFTTDGNKAAVKVAESYVADSDVTVEVKAKVTIGDVEIDETESVTIKASKNFTKVEAEASAETIANGDTVIITPSSDYTGAIEYDYAVKNADGLDIVKNEKGEFEVKISDSYIATEDKDAEITIKGTAGGLTKWAETIKLTVSANFKGIKAELSKDEIKPSETATITVTPEGGYTGDGIKYTYTVAEEYADLVTVEEVETTDEETGETKTETVVKVSDKYVSSTGEDVDITVSADGYDGMEETLTLAIAKNYTFVYNDYEVIEGDEQTYAMDSGDELVVKIDGPDDKVTGVAVYNETLWERFWNDEELTDDEKKAMSFGNMVEGEDYIIEHGSTVVTLTDSFMAKLMAGEHVLYVDYYDDTNIDSIVAGYAQGTVTVVEAATPDTGANTKVAGGATTSALATASLLGAGAVLAMLTKRYAKNARK